ncbi:hypothetical protein CCUS01_16245 [Colletotrichum cuscutae]|uniref:Uncharacterized protein n=1 Tax=Colletotrichum cuscutae TaxID=1209917 RepID=A0AAI9VBX9_9PEZI|nr:hypothetical protein CCUS01_16245 [Colletotrichum cuscutae]
MSEPISRCTVCLATFDSRQELREHAWAFQAEIAALIARLQAISAHQRPESVRTSGETSSRSSSSIIECTVCWETFTTHEEVREHIWAFQTRFATLFSQIHVLLVHQQLEYKNTEPQDSGNDFEEFSDDSDRGFSKEGRNSRGTLEGVLPPDILSRSITNESQIMSVGNSVHFARPLLLKRNAKPAIAQTAREEFHGDLAQVQPVPANDPVHQATAFRDRLSVQPNSASQITDMIDPDPTCLSFDVVTQSPPPHSQHHQTPIWFDGRHSSDRSGQLHIMSTPLWPMSNMTTSNQLTSFGVRATSLVGFSGSAEVFQQMDPAAYL